MQAKDLTPGTRIVVTVAGRDYPVKVKQVSRPSPGRLVVWYKSVDKWAKGDDCVFYANDETVTLA